MEIFTQSAQETKKLGESFADCLKSGNATWQVLALTGELGAGKTTFVQGFAKGLGIKKRILSPTFVMMRSYKLRNLPYKNFYHVDLYRAEGEKDIKNLGLKEIFFDKQNIIVVEWAERIKNALPKNTCWLKFEYEKETKRKITIT